MSVLMIHAKVKSETTAEVEKAVRAMFRAIDEAKPQGIRYMSSRLPDGVSFVAVTELEDGVENPLPKVPAFTEFQEKLKKWLAEPPVADELTLIGSYRSF